MTNKNNFQKNDQHPVNGIDMKTLEKLGRWLCIEFYRDPRELQRCTRDGRDLQRHYSIGSCIW